MKSRSFTLCFVALVAYATSAAWADLADLTLRDGLILRGDVEATADEFILRNAAGELRYPRSEVQEVARVGSPATVDEEYAWRFQLLLPDDVEGHWALAQYLNAVDRPDLLAVQCRHLIEIAPDHADAQALLADALARTTASQPDSRPSPDRNILPAPALLSKKDVLRLKLHEFRLTGGERVEARFLREPGQPSLERDVITEIRTRDDYDPDWERRLAQGRAADRLPVILRATGLRHLDRIEIHGDPAAFASFRRSVLPLVMSGCATAGCHQGESSPAFRLPTGPISSEEFAYTSFMILDGLQSSAGPLIDREFPDQSALLEYLLPTRAGRAPAHPLVKDRPIRPLTRGPMDPRYREIASWIRSLRTPRPDYGLDWRPPGEDEP